MLINFYNIDKEPLLWGNNVIECNSNIPFGNYNVVILERTFFEDFVNKFDKHSDKNFIILHKSMDDYYLVPIQEQKKFIDYVSNSKNIKVIWDLSQIKIKNFYFHPKTHVQNFYNNNYAFPADLYLYGQEIFKTNKNKKRIGLHLNGVTDFVRLGLTQKLKEHINFFYTINSNNHYNMTNKIKTNYISQIYDCIPIKIGLSYNKYIDNFLSQNVKSEMELVYETFSINRLNKSCIKWTEKTLKHLFLGKPFVHVDPISHQLMKINGFSTYDSLFTENLLKKYENTNIDTISFTNDFFWLDELIDNINWLLNMSYEEWKERINEADLVADKNRKRVFELIFETSYLNFIEGIFTSDRN